MWLIFFWIFVLLFKQNNANSLDNKTPSKYSQRRSKYVMSDEKIEHIILLNKAYSSVKWEYNRYCQLYFPLATTPHKCKIASKDQKLSCFGHPIDYNYVRNEDQKLPRSLGLLRQFPSCWKKISPLICAYFYRPCAYQLTTNNQINIERIKQKGNTNELTSPVKEEKRNELWQILPIESCREAKSECNYLEALGLWPSFLDCQSAVETKAFPYVATNTTAEDFRLFGKLLTLPLKIKSKESQECVWPLVFQQSNETNFASPVIDACFLSCRNALIKSTMVVNMFHAVTLLVVLCFLAFFIYLFPLIKHIEVLILTQATFWTATHYLLLSLPIISYIFEAIVCANNGQVRRNMKPIHLRNISNLQGLGEVASLCHLQSIMLAFSILCSYYWLTVFLLRQIFFFLRQRKQNVKTISKNTVSRWVYSLVYPIAAIYCIGSIASTAAAPDGIIGVCYLALGTMKTAAFIWAPIFFFLVVLAVPVFWGFLLFILDYFDQSVGNKSNYAHANRSSGSNFFSTNSKKPLINEETGTSTRQGHDSTPSLLPLPHFVVIYAALWLSFAAFYIFNYLLYGNTASEEETVFRSVVCSINSAISNESVYFGSELQGSYEKNNFSQSNLGSSGCELPKTNIPVLYLLGYLIVFPALPLATACLCILHKTFTQSDYLVQSLCFQTDTRLPLEANFFGVSSNHVETTPNNELNQMEPTDTTATTAHQKIIRTTEERLRHVPSTVSGLPVEELISTEACKSLIVESDINNYSGEHLTTWLDRLLPPTKGGSAKNLNEASTDVSAPSFRSDPQGMHPKLVREVIDQRELGASSADSDQTFNMTSASSFAPHRSHPQNGTNALLPPIDLTFINAVYAFNLGMQSGASLERQMWLEQMHSGSTSSLDETNDIEQSEEEKETPPLQCSRQSLLQPIDSDNKDEEVDENTEQGSRSSSLAEDTSTEVESDYNDDERYPDSDEERMLKEELEKHKQHCLSMAVQLHPPQDSSN